MLTTTYPTAQDIIDDFKMYGIPLKRGWYLRADGEINEGLCSACAVGSLLICKLGTTDLKEIGRLTGKTVYSIESTVIARETGFEGEWLEGVSFGFECGDGNIKYYIDKEGLYWDGVKVGAEVARLLGDEVNNDD